MTAVTQSRVDLVDRLVEVALFAGTVAYLAALPRYLGWADESYFLYEAKRIRDGEVMYRDIFQFITPLASYLMALLFWLFGTTIATARLAMAVLHGALCGVLYATGRVLGIRRAFALLVPLAFLSVCQPVWPFASPHWFSTAVSMGVLAALLWESGTRRRSAAVGLGLLLGVLTGVQQQKGLTIALGTCLIVIVDRLLDVRFARPRGAPGVPARLAWTLVGVLAVIVPLGLAMVASAGVRPVYEALVVFPLDSYRRGHFIRWGAAAPLTDSFSAATFPNLLRWSPLMVLPPLMRLLAGAVRGRSERTVRHLSILVAFACFSVLSIWYFPDLIHIAFIAPIFLLCAAESLEWVVQRPRLRRLPFVLGSSGAVALAAALGYQLLRNTTTMRQEFTIPHDTAFGRIDFARPWEPMMVDAVRTLLNDVPGRELFSYPNVSSIYLTAGAHNPTRYQYLLARVSPAEQIAEVQSILRARKLPYLIVSPMIFMARDPLATFITERYESAPVQRIVDAGELPAFWLYRRKADPPDEP